MNTLRISRRQLQALPEYTCTLPTGAYVGKLWRRHEHGRWFIGGYFTHPDPDKVAIKWFKPFLTIRDNEYVEKMAVLCEQNVQRSFGR